MSALRPGRSFLAVSPSLECRPTALAPRETDLVCRSSKSEHLDQDFLATQAQRHTLLRPRQMQHHPSRVAQPQIAGT